MAHEQVMSHERVMAHKRIMAYERVMPHVPYTQTMAGLHRKSICRHAVPQQDPRLRRHANSTRDARYWRFYICDVTHAYVCDMTHICVYRDPFMFLTSRHANCTRNARYCRFHVYICVNAPRYTRECTHQWVMNSYVCYDMCIQDSFIRVFTCVTWRIHMLIWLTDLLFVTLTLNQHVDTPCHNKINLSNPFEVMHNLYVNLIWGHGLHVSVSYHTCDTPYHNNIHGPLAYVWRDSCLHETLLIRTCNVTH